MAVRCRRGVRPTPARHDRSDSLRAARSRRERRRRSRTGSEIADWEEARGPLACKPSVAPISRRANKSKSKRRCPVTRSRRSSSTVSGPHQQGSEACIVERPGDKAVARAMPAAAAAMREEHYT